MVLRDPACDCRRVLFLSWPIIAEATRRRSAIPSIGRGNGLDAGANLPGPALPQSDLAEELLELCKDARSPTPSIAKDWSGTIAW